MAENNSILDKLEGLVSRYEEVGTLITDPNVISDQKRYVKLTKEYKDLGDIMKARKEYMDSLQTLQDAKEMLATEDDPEMKEMAREEMATAEKHIPEMEERIKLLLVPADPEDDKNVIMEIRGGTGGDEAALFAGDLFRMYTKYTNRAYIAYNAYRLRKHKAAYIPRPQRWPYCPKPKNSTWKSTREKSNGTLSVPAAQADRT